MWNLFIKHQYISNRKIAVIDLRVLRRLGIGSGSSTEDFGFRHHNKRTGTGTPYATKHHILVLGWLPPQCILGFLSIGHFEKLLARSHINNSRSGYVPLSEYDKIITFSSMSHYLPEAAALSALQGEESVGCAGN
ncbi:hypothetical protein ONS95_012885 [Cadophora gregata]|uniref:uncharacterized protein n=1 Tax=Cadophora gregata TaxID=51156 RepID=UPI0026DB6324|nr:uncharacterized protein ONS95_012885 [Cadophora gregata]KAK0101134.1 hypothetical protein ONS96_006359 [Cadophora gregata f. sp. sojae]KAK0115834.1 hypothetical protein ONS95_012885 [Cadophora gregata]